MEKNREYKPEKKNKQKRFGHDGDVNRQSYEKTEDWMEGIIKGNYKSASEKACNRLV